MATRGGPTRWWLLLACAAAGCWPAFDTLQGGGEDSTDAAVADARPTDATSPRVDGGDSATTQQDAARGDASDASPPAEGGASTYAAAVLADTPLAYWRLDETAGATTAADSSPNGIDATYSSSGVTLGAPGALAGGGTAALFDGVSGLLSVGDKLGFAGGVPFTFEMWLEPTELVSFQRILDKEQLTGGPRSGYTLVFDRGTNDAAVGYSFEEYAGGDAGGFLSTNNLPPTGSFTYVVVTFDGAMLVLYVNGGMLQSDVPPFPLENAAGYAFVWAAATPPNGSFFSGALDELAVYDHALSQARITAHFEAAHAP